MNGLSAIFPSPCALSQKGRSVYFNESTLAHPFSRNKGTYMLSYPKTLVSVSRSCLQRQNLQKAFLKLRIPWLIDYTYNYIQRRWTDKSFSVHCKLELSICYSMQIETCFFLTKGLYARNVGLYCIRIDSIQQPFYI